MNWIVELLHSNVVAQSIFILGLVTASGLFLGSIRVFGVSLEIAGVLFAGLLFGFLGANLQPEVIDFLRDFGLVLFVYSIGVQVGPGFMASLKRDGIRLNILAASIVLLGVAVTLGVHFFGKVEMPVAVGLFSGGTTNTPSLAAAQQAMKDMPGLSETALKMPTIGYAVAYPFGIIGIILTMLLMKAIFRIHVHREAQAHAQTQETSKSPVETMNLLVKNPNLDGLTIAEIPALNQGIVISRIKHGPYVNVALPQTKVHVGDILLAVGTRPVLDELRIIVGELSDQDLRKLEAGIATQRIVVTKKSVLGKSVENLDLINRYGVTATRLIRRDVELPVFSTLVVEFGDVLLCVGTKDGLEKASKEMGNSAQALNHPQLIPVFFGIALGVLLGSIPFFIPGMPAPVKLGLAGGPLLVSILLSRISRIGPVVCYMPPTANFMMREIGIVLFLACVGLKSGDQFVSTVLSGQGLYWMSLGALITFVPLLLIALVSRLVFKMNFMTLCGLLAGSMTDPPALAFANTQALSTAPSLSYAAVYPLVMILRVISAQILVLIFVR